MHTSVNGFMTSLPLPLQLSNVWNTVEYNIIDGTSLGLGLSLDLGLERELSFLRSLSSGHERWQRNGNRSRRYLCLVTCLSSLVVHFIIFHFITLSPSNYTSQSNDSIPYHPIPSLLICYTHSTTPIILIQYYYQKFTYQY